MSVYSVSMSTQPSFSKAPTAYIYLLTHHGVQGDIHCSSTPSSTNLRQVSLVASELLTYLATPSSTYPTFSLSSGALGENITTAGVDLVSLSEGTKLHFGDHDGHAVVRITGLREPRRRLEEWPEGLLERCKGRDGKGKGSGRKVGVMGVVEADGYVQPGHVIFVEQPKHSRPLRSL